MSKRVIVAWILSLVSSSATYAASAGFEGSYVGTTSDGRFCKIKIQESADSLFAEIGWEDEAGRFQGCGFFAKSRTATRDSIEITGGSEFSVCKARLYFDQKGYLSEARLGIGTFFQFGYDETCGNLSPSH